MNIYIKLEVESRELLSRTMLGMYAASKGHDVYLGDDELLKYVQKNKLNPGIILEKSITPAESRIKQLFDYKRNNSVVTSIDEEGGILKDNLDVFLNGRFSERTISLTDKIFCWGEFDYNSLKKKFPKYSKKFIKTGNPRVNLWSKKFNKLFYMKDIKKKKYILISSNFRIGTTSKRLSDNFGARLKNNYYKKKENKNDYYKIATFKLGLFFKFVSAVDYLTEKFPKLNFMIRPHPSESSKNWKKFFTPKKNLQISEKFSHSEWIENSDIIIHNGCTGGLEAFARGKKIISYKPINTYTGMDFSNNFGHEINNEVQLGNLIKKIYNSKKIKKVNKKYKNQFIHRLGNVDKENFAKNILNEWEKFDNQFLSKKNNFIFIKFINKIRLLKNIFIKPYYNPKFPPLDKKKINNILEKVKKTDNSLKDVNFELIGPKLFKLKLIK